MNDFGFIVDYRDGAYLELTGTTDDLFVVDFYDEDTGNLEFSESITSGRWLKTEKRYFVNWYIVVRDITGTIVFEDKFSADGKDVVIDINNVALGDTIAWVPYCEEFRKKHNCNLTVHTNFFKLFEDVYPQITWKPLEAKLSTEYDCYSYYKIYIGIDEFSFSSGMKKINYYHANKIPIKFIPNLTFHDVSIHKEHPFEIPLQKTMSNFLGVEFKEIRPSLPIVNSERPMEQKYICISEFASSEGMKQWNNKIGWKSLVKEFKNLGYEVVSISKERTELKDVIKRNGDYPLSDRVWYLQHCEFFVGLGSGLSWLGWAAGTKVVMIAGHSEKWVEFQENCVRIINEDVCHGCYNNKEHMDKFCCYHATLCPENKNFVCTRAISPKMVMDKIKENNLLI